jgi:hypothetical protein
LGRKTPDWGLSRWGGNRGLRFVPLDDEGYKLRGDRRRLVYKGRLRSHRITILDNTSFEYDCILEREPENNVITILLEGAEQYDFFRQPDFVSNPFLKGSYAVYKKETLIGEGTGKLCHIHRPLVIDGRGRRCWGDLSITGNELRITIPEKWLGKAKYPVVVDPVVGTSTVGSQVTGPDPNNDEYDRPWLDNEYALNKYLVPQNGNGICTAYVYCCNDDTESYATPCLYTNVNNKPYMKKSQNEKEIAVWFNTPTWKSNTFSLDGSISAGDYVWFGIYSSWFTTRFDYGGECYKGWFPWDTYEEYEGEPTPYITIGPWDSYCTIKWSWYFDYTAAIITSQNYVRTITQGVELADNRKLTADYKRSALQTVQGITRSYSATMFFRQCVMNAANTMNLSRIPFFIRAAIEQTGIVDGLKPSRDLYRYCDETTKAKDETGRSQGFIRNLYETIKATDDSFYPVVFVRSISETSGIADTFRQWGAYIRGLYDKAGNIAEPERKAEYYRATTKTVQAEGSVFRGLLIFVRIQTTSFVRDFLIRRFLIAREELILKSYITRELQLESKIN